MRREDTNVAKHVTTMKVGGKRPRGRQLCRKAQTEVDGPSAERFETTPARPKADTEPRRMAKGNHGDRPRTWIRSAQVRKGTHMTQSQMLPEAAIKACIMICVDQWFE